MASGLFERRGCTSSHKAPEYPRELPCLEELRKGAVDVNKQSWCGETLLHVACQSKCAEVNEAVCLLLQNGANVNMCDKQGRTPLLCAAMNGNLDVVTTLLTSGNADPDICDIFGQNPMYESAFMDHWEIAEFLFRAGASLQVSKRYGNTLIHLAAIHSPSRCLEKLLQAAVEKGQKEVVDFRCRNGVTPLMNASYGGHVECVKVLLKFGANPNLKVSKLSWVGGYVTALHYAIDGEHAECIELLLNNMDLQQLVHHADCDYVCPLQAAIKRNNQDLLKRLLSLGFPVNNIQNVQNMLSERGINMRHLPYVYNGLRPKFETPLSYAAAMKDIESMQILLDYGASVNPILCDIVNENEVQSLSIPPVFSALCSQSWEAFDLLIRHGCDVSCQLDGICPSQCLLLSFYNYNSAKKLLMLGADPHLIFQQGDDSYERILSYLGNFFSTAGHEAFFRILERLLQFLVTSQPVQRLFHDVFKLCHQLEPEWCAQEQCNERWKAILQQIDKPSSLTNLCRVKIRQTLISKISVRSYLAFRAAINDLCLPKILKRYLLHSKTNGKRKNTDCGKKRNKKWAT